MAGGEEANCTAEFAVGAFLAEAYGVQLTPDYDGEVPPQMQMMDVLEGEYIVFEHGAFDFETENAIVEAEIEKAMKEFDYSKSRYQLDTTPGRVFYFYHYCKRFWKYVRPVKNYIVDGLPNSVPEKFNFLGVFLYVWYILQTHHANLGVDY